MATARETTSENSAAFHAVIRSTPSRMKRVNRGSMATSAVSASDPETASRTGRYIGHLVFGRDGTYVLLRRPGGATRLVRSGRSPQQPAPWPCCVDRRVSVHMVLPKRWVDHSGRIPNCREFSAANFEAVEPVALAPLIVLASGGGNRHGAC